VQRFIRDLEAEMETYVSMIPYRNPLLSIKAIGTVTDAAIIGKPTRSAEGGIAEN